MSLANWFKRATAAASSPRLERLIGSVVAYLKTRPPDEEVSPNIVGRAIGETELAAMTALSILERDGITKHHFGIYCGETDVPIASHDSPEGLPDEGVPCYVCDREHRLSDKSCKAEVYFTVDHEKLSRFRSQASAA
jgi:hypothetical protein